MFVSDSVMHRIYKGIVNFERIFNFRPTKLRIMQKDISDLDIQALSKIKTQMVSIVMRMNLDELSVLMARFPI